MTSMCGAIHTLFSSIISFLSSLLSLLLCKPRSSPIPVDLELGGADPFRVVTKSASPSPHTVDLLKVRDATDSSRIAMVVPNSLSGKVAPTLEEYTEEPVTRKLAMPTNNPFPRSSTDSSSDDDNSSDGHSIESSFTSGGIAVEMVDKYQHIGSLRDEQPARDGTFVEAMEGSLNNHAETDESSEVQSPTEERDRDHHFRQFFQNVDINETDIGVERSSDEGTQEDDDPDVPAHRWLKFAIEFVWLHKLPNTIQESQEVEDEEVAREAGIKGFGNMDGREEDIGFYAEGHTPEIIEHPPTPPIGPVLETSLCRVKEVTEDLVDLLTSLKVTLRDSPTSFCTTTTSNKSDTFYDAIEAAERSAISEPPSPEPLYDKFGKQIEMNDVYQSLDHESDSQDAHIGFIPDDSSFVSTAGCTWSSCHIPLPIPSTLSHSDLDSPP